MITRDELASYVDELLACNTFKDYAPNGVQVEGKQIIKQICTAVTASADVIKKAIALHADALIVHHGYFWRGEDSVITGMKHKRISLLIKHDINLLAYHLPLDCHLELGNNACFAELLEVSSPMQHTAGNTANLLWSGELAQSYTADEFSAYLNKKLQREPLKILGTNKPIASVAWCTGAAQDFIVDAHALGVDAYLSGEVSERTYYQAQELGIQYFACGHHASERYGIQALGEHLRTHFDINHQFIDSINPI